MAPFTITRTVVIAAPAADVRPHLVDFRSWQPWSPWEGLDADLTRTYTGSEQGAGSRYAWEGRKSGAGSMEITVATEHRIEIDLRFTRPWKATNRVTLLLTPDVDGTAVTWTMDGENTGLAALFARLFSLDAMLGKDFEKGLAALKTVVEDT
ncbi:MAG: SRPBCC family protein [Propioniciclava sp.]